MSTPYVTTTLTNTGGSAIVADRVVIVDPTTGAPSASGGSAVQGNVASGATDSGNPVKVGGVYKATPPTLTDGQRGDLEVDTRENLKVVIGAVEVVSAASITALASLATSQQLLAANTARAGLILNNTDANGVYVKYGATASATSFTVLIPTNGYWEMPQPVYVGRIDAIWSADGVGSLVATEL